MRAALVLSHLTDSRQRIAALFGKRLGIVPYFKPGFQLAKAALDTFKKNPNVEGLFLLKHGLVTFGESARESYERMINLVNEIEKGLALSPSHENADSAKTVAHPQAKAFMIKIRLLFLRNSFSPILCLDQSKAAKKTSPPPAPKKPKAKPGNWDWDEKTDSFEPKKPQGGGDT